ncbi:unnamed protein product [Paramecium sonneborni]|uniref:Uncharacterized protein n=1 Tax=Paramecium sonneborni TaxID=65129 RepID=A0A8S1Q1I7_9CILI|nr:unnamed protein product [Paramecium sonneborni]
MVCQQGKCIKCMDGYQSIAGKCLEILNDGHRTGYEQCDDMNLIAEDGCFNGQFDYPRECEYCYQGQCLKCHTETNQLDLIHNQCIQLCIDEYLSNDEKCDDYIQIHFGCNEFCEICQNYMCTKCQIGYYLDKQKNSCYSISGDGIVSHNEQCDIGDYFMDQQCASCKLKCQK